MAWMRVVAGRLKSDYRYSKDIVYNNFVWPDVLGNNSNNDINNFDLKPGATAPGDKNAARLRGDDQKVVLGCPSCLQIEKAAQAVLDARAAHPNATLADLYDPLTMPPDLVKAHAHLDALVDKAYGLSPSCTDLGRVAHLFKLYADKVKKV